MKLALALTIALLASPSLAALSEAEKAIVAAVGRDQAWAVDELEQLVDVNSGTLNLAGVTRVGAMLRPQLETLGFTVAWKPMAEVGRAGHLVATHTGRRAMKRVLLIGHLDTVFEPDSPFQKFTRQGDTASGRAPATTRAASW